MSSSRAAAADLVLTVGAAPTVNVRVTNTTGAAATLYGWIDYNQNGVLDNATERASVPVPSSSMNVIQMLTFPAVPSGSAGTTYARFRLSTDAAAANPTGVASDGEVEDYVATIAPADGTKTKIASGANGGPMLADGDAFGHSVASLGDLDGDGATDLAVAAGGVVHMLFLNTNGTVRSSTKIASGTGGGPTLADGDYFGSSVASLGDLDGDGVTDLAVGAHGDDTGGSFRGAVHVLLMNSDGTVKGSTKIADSTNGGPTLDDHDYFGGAVSSLGDLDGNGVTDLAVGAEGDGFRNIDRGAVYTLFLTPPNRPPTITSSTTASIAENQTAVLLVRATDPAQTVTFSITGGADQAQFSITAVGALTFPAPDFENPADADSDNVYEVTVKAEDGNGGTDTQTIMVTVTNVAPKVVAVELVMDAAGKKVTQVIVVYDEPILVAAAETTGNYRLTKRGKLKPQPITTATYDATAMEVALRPRKPVSFKRLADFALTLRGDGTLADTPGLALDGDADGAPGGDFVLALSQANTRIAARTSTREAIDFLLDGDPKFWPTCDGSGQFQSLLSGRCTLLKDPRIRNTLADWRTSGFSLILQRLGSG